MYRKILENQLKMALERGYDEGRQGCISDSAKGRWSARITKQIMSKLDQALFKEIEKIMEETPHAN